MKKFDIQFFNDENTTAKVEENKDVEMLSQDQVNEIVSKRLTKEKAKWEKEYSKKLELERAEAQRLAEMDAEQRQQEEFNKRLQALEERESVLKMNELKLETSNVLKDRGLPSDFVDLVISKDDESTLNNINLLDKLFKDAIKNEVEKRIPTFTPNHGQAKSGEMTREEFKALPLTKQNELYMSNKELYKNYF